MAPQADEIVVIYGFSGKAAFDTFAANSELSLTPYPLVKGYLQSQVNAASKGIKLVAIDAVGPLAPSLYAAAMDCVLDAMLGKRTILNAGYLLVFDPDVAAYRLAMSSDSTAPNDITEPSKLI